MEVKSLRELLTEANSGIGAEFYYAVYEILGRLPALLDRLEKLEAENKILKAYYGNDNVGKETV